MLKISEARTQPRHPVGKGRFGETSKEFEGGAKARYATLYLMKIERCVLHRAVDCLNVKSFLELRILHSVKW